MTIGNRIGTLRKQLKYSQEYVAEQLGVSRQAVSKWEKDISKPDTDNIILLAELLNTNVDYILTGNTNSHTDDNNKKKKSPNHKRKILVGILSILVSAVIISVIIFIHLCPVDWEAGACHGGYITSVFNKYSNELVDKYYHNSDEKDNISDIKALKGTQQGDWENRSIFLEFDIEYFHKDRGLVKERLHFVGKRIWFNTYKWTVGPIIEG